ncbi:MAG: carboxymuconolactone decarboxylase family protein [Gemmatimonadaceae bacterium]
MQHFLLARAKASRMSFIPIIPPSQADAALASAYASILQQRGSIADILGVHSVNPRVMLAHVRLYQDIMFASSPLSRAERETVAVAVSHANDCHY